jgi:predicted HTH transcriptional regulator
MAMRDLRALVDRGILEQVGTSKMKTQYVLAKESP